MMHFTQLRTVVFVFILLLVFLDGFELYNLSQLPWLFTKPVITTEVVRGSFSIAAVISGPVIGKLHDTYGHTKFIIVLAYFLKLL